MELILHLWSSERYTVCGLWYINGVCIFYIICNIKRSMKMDLISLLFALLTVTCNLVDAAKVIGIFSLCDSVNNNIQMKSIIIKNTVKERLTNQNITYQHYDICSNINDLNNAVEDIILSRENYYMDKGEYTSNILAVIFHSSDDMMSLASHLFATISVPVLFYKNDRYQQLVRNKWFIEKGSSRYNIHLQFLLSFIQEYGWDELALVNLGGDDLTVRDGLENKIEKELFFPDMYRGLLFSANCLTKMQFIKISVTLLLLH